MTTRPQSNPRSLHGRVVLVTGGGRGIGRFISIFDDVETMIEHAAEIELQNLYSLKIEKVAGAGGNAALAAVLADARQAAEQQKKQSSAAAQGKKLA